MCTHILVGLNLIFPSYSNFHVDQVYLFIYSLMHTVQLFHFGQDAVLAFSEIVHRTFGEQNLNSIKKCARNLQPKSLIPKESRGDGSKSSILKNNKDRVLCRYILFWDYFYHICPNLNKI